MLRAGRMTAFMYVLPSGVLEDFRLIYKARAVKSEDIFSHLETSWRFQAPRPSKPGDRPLATVARLPRRSPR